MNREQILATFRSLATSQGFYGRLLEQIDSVDEEACEAFLSDLEKPQLQGFGRTRDVD